MAYDNSRPPEDKSKSAPRVVYTRKNTTLEKWKEMVIAECARKEIDPSIIRPFEMLHGWEDGSPPEYFVDIYVRRRAKDVSRGR
jgi:hypothetical protein